MKKNPRLHGLRDIRKAKGWTLEECAERLGIHTRALSAYEQGSRAPEFPERVARIMGCSVDELLDWKEVREYND